MKYLVTGGCGFIGTNLVKDLLSNNEDITILDNFSNNRPGLFEEHGNDIEIIEGSTSDFKLVKDLIHDLNIDVVIHLAARSGIAPSVEDPIADFENVQGTFNCLEASRLGNVKKFIYASSGSCVGEYPPPFHENLCPRPTAPYSASKAIGELHCCSYFYTYGLNTVSLRFGNIYGAFSKHKDNLIPNLIKDKLSNKETILYGDGSQTRDFLYIKDLINAIKLSIKKDDIGGQVFQIATNMETSATEIIKILNMIFNEKEMSKASIKQEDFREGDLKRNFSDTSKAKIRLGWENNFSLYEGLKETTEWYLRENH